MRPALLVFTILLLTVPVSAQPIAGTAAEKCTVEGQVVAAGTGQPLKKARVILSREKGRGKPQVVVTDAGGRFRLTDIEPGRYRLSVNRNGYVSQQYGQRRPNRPGAILSLAPGQHLREIDFRLLRHSVISGSVYDEDGEPVLGAEVEALRFRYARGRRRLLPTQRTATNDLGEYRLYGLAPGRYYVSALYTPGMTVVVANMGRMAAMSTGASEQDRSYVPTFYPGTSDPARASPVEVRAGDEVPGVDLTLLPTRTVRVRGRVFNSITGEHNRNIAVYLMPRDHGSGIFPFHNSARSVDREGRFEIEGVRPGSYFLTATYFDSEEEESYEARRAIEVGDSDVEDITLVIEQGVELQGRIHVEGVALTSRQEQGIGGEEAPEEFPIREIEVYLTSYDDVLILPRPRAGRPKADGSFRIEKVSPMLYRVNLNPLSGDYYLKAARAGGKDVLEAGLDLTGGAPPNPLEITISAAGGRIDGAVLTEEQEGFGGASVVLVSEERRRDQRRFYKTTTTDQHGRFTLRGIPPGDYKLFAWEEIERGAYRDPAFLRRYEEQGELVEVEEGSRLSVQLHLIHADGPPR